MHFSLLQAFYNIITRNWTTEQKEQAIEALVASLDESVQVIDDE